MRNPSHDSRSPLCGERGRTGAGDISHELVFKAHRLCASLNSRRRGNNDEEEEKGGGTGAGDISTAEGGSSPSSSSCVVATCVGLWGLAHKRQPGQESGPHFKVRQLRTFKLSPFRSEAGGFVWGAW